jgi:uncharacterized membrane protein YkoI
MNFKNKVYWAVALVAILAIAGAAVTVTSRLTAASGSSSTPDACDQSAQATEAPGTETADDSCTSNDAADATESENGSDTKDANEAEDGNDTASQPAGQLDDGKDLLPQAGITLDAAVVAAQGAASGKLGEVDLEQYKGKLVFNVDIGDKDVKIDAANGAVLATEASD